MQRARFRARRFDQVSASLLTRRCVARRRVTACGNADHHPEARQLAGRQEPRCAAGAARPGGCLRSAAVEDSGNETQPSLPMGLVESMLPAGIRAAIQLLTVA